MTITIEEILRGVGFGRTQSVGHMGVVPLVDGDGSCQDETFAPPDVGVSNDNYGSVDIHNEQDRPTIVPTGAGWITKRAAQDHAIAGAVLIKGSSSTHIDTAMCIESSQGGYMVKGDHEMIVLPAALRAPALAMRTSRSYGKLWNSIGQMHTTYTGQSARRQHMSDFLHFFKKDLDEFVAQFELIPNQIGAIVLLGDRIVGIERAPTVAFWSHVWSPLIRVCYGSLAIRARQILGTQPPRHRLGLELKTRSLAGIAQALEDAETKTRELVGSAIDNIRGHELQASDTSESKLDGYEVVTLASDDVAGQIVRRGVKTPYASLCRPYDPRHDGV